MRKERARRKPGGSRDADTRGRAAVVRQRREAGNATDLAASQLVYSGRYKDELRITALSYGPDAAQETEIHDPEDLAHLRNRASVLWVSVEGIHRVDALAKIGRIFSIHQLVLQDIVNTAQRPKIEESDEYVFVSMKGSSWNEKESVVVSEHVCLVWGKNFLLSFREIVDDTFTGVRNRIRARLGRAHREGPDFLAAALIGHVADDYFLILEKLSEKLETLEDELLGSPSKDALVKLHELKMDIIWLHRSVWPLREALFKLMVGDSPFVSASARPYFQDVYDHALHVSETLDIYRDISAELMDVYLSSASNRLNEIMKVLAMIATLFMPLTFLCGWYGMNFKYMPELDKPWAYPMVMVAALSIAGGMLFYFRRKGWL
jgi:magnesium transporter